MEITEDVYIFWLILEDDLKTKLPSHLKNIFSFNGYGNALAFGDINVEDIKNIEVYVRETLPKLLEISLKESNTLYSSKQKSWFFGMFAVDPSSFFITGGEMKLIQKAIKKVNEIIEHQGPEHYFRQEFFKKKNRCSYEHKMCESVFGLVFGDMRQIEKEETEKNIIELKTKLFHRTTEKLTKFESQQLIRLRPFTTNSIHVTLANTGQFQGRIDCCFCSEESPFREMKVFYKMTGNGSWILSNFDSHMVRHHCSNETDLLNVPKKRRHKTTDEKQHFDENIIPNVISAADVHINKTTTIHLDIELIDSNTADNLFLQLKQQIIKMTNHVVKNEDMIEETTFAYEGKGTKILNTLKFCRVAGDGNCLFLSLSHQLHGYKMDSKKLSESATELRNQIVDHILLHLSDFQIELKGRIYENDSSKKIQQVEKGCRDFVTNTLAREGNWGGIETIKAFSRVYNINVIIINDDGSCYLPCHLNPKSERSILLFFHPNNNEEICQRHNSERIHYDSVVGVSDYKLGIISKELIEVERNALQNKDSNDSHISID